MINALGVLRQKVIWKGRRHSCDKGKSVAKIFVLQVSAILVAEKQDGK